jgi:uncharacterized protein (DUF1697 family)
MPNTTRYIAFLRGINVGGNKLIKMDALAAAFTAAGFRNVKTYIASGNVIFDSKAKLQSLETKAEKRLLEVFGHEIAVCIFSLAELEELLKHDLFARVRSGSEAMLLVTFLKQEIAKIKLPLESEKENLKVIAIKGRAAFTVARRKKTGWFGFPNNFIEKELGIAATTRQWRTVQKVVAVAKTI